MLIEIKDIHGEEGTGYEDRVVNGVDKGEFECQNCEYFKEGTCGQKTMIARAKKIGIELKNGRRPVDPEGCCEFVDRIGNDGKFDMSTASWVDGVINAKVKSSGN